LKDIIIIGGGGHAKVIAAMLKKDPKWNPIGYTEMDDKGELLGLPYLGNDIIITSLIKEYKLSYGVIGIGQLRNIVSRKELITSIEETDLSLPPIISKHAIINEDVRIGDGTVVMDGVIIQPGVRIGKYSIINTGATIDHDCEIGDFVHIAPGVNVSGGIFVGDNVLIGVGTKIIEGIHIIGDVIIAAGSVVKKDILRAGTYAGVPARMLK